MDDEGREVIGGELWQAADLAQGAGKPSSVQAAEASSDDGRLERAGEGSPEPWKGEGRTYVLAAPTRAVSSVYLDSRELKCA